MNLTGAVALVTGSSSGIGAAAARNLARHGCRVAVTWSGNKSAAQEVVGDCEKAGSEAKLFHLDIRDDSECRQVVEKIIQQWGQLDVLVNCAGTTRVCDPMDLDGLSAEDFLEIFRVNVVGTFQITRAAASHLKTRPIAHVINISSTAAFNGRGSSIAYAASKGAMITMAKSLARVLGPAVRVNTVCPGLVESAWTKKSLGEKAYQKKIRLAALRSTLKALPSPDDIASAIVSCLQGGDLMTGSVLVVDGGAHLGTAHLSHSIDP
jgi:3-oxoacyl-[acyl-carrier protein] reductase